MSESPSGAPTDAGPSRQADRLLIRRSTARRTVSRRADALGSGGPARLSPFWARGFFWFSALSIPASSVVSIAVLAHVLGPGELATISAIFGLSFLGTVLPIGIQARSAADAAERGSAASIAWRPIYVGSAMWVAASPFLAFGLHVPVLAMLSPALGLIPSLVVGLGRGEMIGQQRFVGAAANHLVESAARLVGGVGLGVWLGANGVALSLIACQLLAWVLLPRRDRVAPGFVRLPSASIATALVVLSIQIDLLMAPRLLDAGASAYATSALPAKAVYLSLAATAWLVVPRAARCTRLGQAVVPLGAVFTIGAILGAVIAAAAPWAGALLGQPTPDARLVLVLGLGMAVASTNWVLMQIRLARAPRLLWLSALIAVLVWSVVAGVVRTDVGFAAGILAGQVCALVVGLRQLHLGFASSVRHAEPVMS